MTAFLELVAHSHLYCFFYCVFIIEPEVAKGAVVNTKENTKNESVLGRQSNRISMSFDFSQIYGSGQETFSSDGANQQQGDARTRDPNDQQCCTVQ